LNTTGGQIITYAGPYPPSEPSNYSVSYVFSQPLVNEGDDVWATDFPGFQQVPGGNIPTGKSFSYNIAGPLLWYDAGAADHCPFFEPVADAFADAPAVPQMAVTNELFQTQYTADGFVAGDLAYVYNGGSGDHNHLTFTLLGDGTNPGGGPDGIYALPLQLTASGATPSVAFYLLLTKNASATDVALASDVIEHPRIAPDLDCDGDVDLEDYTLLLPCLAGPDASIPSALDQEYCPRSDFEPDFDVDLRNFSVFQVCFSGADVHPNPSCVP
jgi:hypothetical protein